MTDPIITEQRPILDPVHAGEEEGYSDRWASRLVLFLRLLATVSLVKGLYHWAIVCGFDASSFVGFEAYTIPFQAATVFFAVIDLVAAVGLWLAAPWGAVIWLLAAVVQGGVIFLLPELIRFGPFVAIFDFALILSYLLLTYRASFERDI